MWDCAASRKAVLDAVRRLVGLGVALVGGRCMLHPLTHVEENYAKMVCEFPGIATLLDSWLIANFGSRASPPATGSIACRN